MTLACRSKASGLDRWARWEVKGGRVAGEEGCLVGRGQQDGAGEEAGRERDGWNAWWGSGREDMVKDSCERWWVKQEMDEKKKVGRESEKK